jgi:hypothetical protein
LKNPLRIQGEKLRRSSSFMHRAIAAEVAEAKELFGEFRIPKAQEGKRFRETQTEAVSTGFVVGAKAEAFDTLEIFHGKGRRRNLNKEHSCHRIRPKGRSRPLKFHVQVVAEGAHGRRRYESSDLM